MSVNRFLPMQMSTSSDQRAVERHSVVLILLPSANMYPALQRIFVLVPNTARDVLSCPYRGATRAGHRVTSDIHRH